ncbi:MAG: ABC transporter permease subunit [Spirochaetales bacterium]|nr:ABC transporter permease subunit [Spirochaetales bacterium]
MIFTMIKINKHIKKILYPVISLSFFYIIWEISAYYIGAEIILPKPITVFNSLIQIILKQDFKIKLLSTLIRGLWGFGISFILGLTVGILAGIFKTFRMLISPIISIVRSTPVISVILLAIIWFKVDNVPIFVAFLMAFPIICGNIIEGITTTNSKLLIMAKLYNVPLYKQVLNIYIPSVFPFIIAGSSMSLGVIWKVIVAAEVLSQPKFGVGTSLNDAKAYLITEEVFAWTIIAILLSIVTENVFSLVSKKVINGKFKY